MNSLNPTWLVIVSVIVAAIPILLGMSTAYIKVSVVLGLLKSALGAQNTPGNVVVMALSMALTFFIMSPVFTKSMDALGGSKFSLQQNVSAQSLKELSPVLEPWREFMGQHSGLRERELFLRLAKETSTENVLPSMRVLLPAFVLSEVKEAFAMGFVLLLPFLVIDLIVANVLAGMGMFMVSPAMISLPLKLLLFVLSDAWLLLSKGLIDSYAS